MKDAYDDEKWWFYRFVAIMAAVTVLLYGAAMLYLLGEIEYVLHDHLHELNDVLIPQLLEVSGG